MPRKKKVIEEVKKLSVREIVKLEKYQASEKGRKLERKNLELKRQNLIVRKNYFLSQIQLIDKEMELLDKICLEVTKEQENRISEYKRLKKEIQKRLQLQDNFGYDDEDGTIIEE